MTLTLAVLAVLAALAAGYGLGRYRPWMRLGDWVNWQLRFHLTRWDRSRHRQAALCVLILVTDPVNTIHAWRHRNDPPLMLSPALRFRENPPANEEATR